MFRLNKGPLEELARLPGKWSRWSRQGSIGIQSPPNYRIIDDGMKLLRNLEIHEVVRREGECYKGRTVRFVEKLVFEGSRRVGCDVSLPLEDSQYKRNLLRIFW